MDEVRSEKRRSPPKARLNGTNFTVYFALEVFFGEPLLAQKLSISEPINATVRFFGLILMSSPQVKRVSVFRTTGNSSLSSLYVRIVNVLRL